MRSTRNLMHLRAGARTRSGVVGRPRLPEWTTTCSMPFITRLTARAYRPVTEVAESQVQRLRDSRDRPAVAGRGFQEKPRQSPVGLASMGVYLFDRASLDRLAARDAEFETSAQRFGKDLLPRLVERAEAVFAYSFADYWQDVGTLDSLYEANLAFLSDRPPARPDDPRLGRHTRAPTVRRCASSRAPESSAAWSQRCDVPGMSYGSVLSPASSCRRGAVVARQHRHARHPHRRDAIDGPRIVDRRCGSGPAMVGTVTPRRRNRACPEHLSRGSPSWQGTSLPAGLTVGRTRASARFGGGGVHGDVRRGVVDGPESMH